MQVDPIKSKLKLPGTKHLNLKSDKPLSNVDFEFNLRRYTAGPELVDAARHRVAAVRAEAPAADVPARAGALGRAVQVDPIKPNLKPAGTNRLKLKYDKSLSTFAFEFKLRRYSWMERRARRDPPGLCLPVPALHRHNVPVTLSWYEASVVQLYSEAFDASFDDVIRLCSGFAHDDDSAAAGLDVAARGGGGGGGVPGALGRAVQVDPIKHPLQAPVTNCLTLA